MLLFIVFYSVGNPLWLGWYEIPLFPLYQILFLTGLAWLGAAGWRERLAKAAGADGPGAMGWRRWAVVVLAVPQLSRLNALPWEPRERAVFGARTRPSTSSARPTTDCWPACCSRPPRSKRLVAIPEIGAFGYLYDGQAVRHGRPDLAAARMTTSRSRPRSRLRFTPCRAS